MLIGSGPSLNRTDIDRLIRGRYTIAVNNCYQIAPEAQALYACDKEWWDYYHESAESFKGEKWTQNLEAAEKYGLNHIPSLGLSGLSDSTEFIHQGNNSGFQALNLAVNWGYKVIYLLGYEMRDTDKTHWFGDYPKRLQIKNPFKRFIRAFDEAAPQLIDRGVRVINCSRNSALECFEKCDITKIKE